MIRKPAAFAVILLFSLSTLHCADALQMAHNIDDDYVDNERGFWDWGRTHSF